MTALEIFLVLKMRVLKRTSEAGVNKGRLSKFIEVYRLTLQDPIQSNPGSFHDAKNLLYAVLIIPALSGVHVTKCA